MKDLVISVKEKIKKLLLVVDELKKENSILEKDIKELKKLNQSILLEQRTYKTLQLVLSKNFKQENLFGFFQQ